MSLFSNFRFWKIAVLSFIFILNGCGDSQPRVSPMASVSQTIGESTEITVTYNRPGVKGREIWGKLVPYDKVWRSGANEATTISFSDDVQIEGQALAAGTYALFTIPAKNEWTVIFNKKADQWGAYDYDSKDDALRIKTTAETASNMEWLDYAFEQLDGASAVLALRWEKLKVPFRIETQATGGEVRASLKAGLSQTLGEATKISIVYGRPGVKGRTIWGDLVPYGQVWRTGANENTTISFSNDILVEGQPLTAGNYGLHTIPAESEWVVIFSKNSTSWGSFSYNESEDALRVTVKPQQSEEFTEWLRFSFPQLTPGADKAITSGQLTLQWGNVQVPVMIGLK